MLYAQTPARRTRQLLGDAFVLGWVLAWVQAARWLHTELLRLGAPGRAVADAGRGLASALDSAASRLGGLPLAGDALRAPFDAASQAGTVLQRAGTAQQHAVGRLAFWLPVLLAALAILPLLGRRLLTRVRWSRQASAAAALRSGAADLDLFALRALARQPLAALHRVTPDPAQDWRRRDPAVIRALARLELGELGLAVRE